MIASCPRHVHWWDIGTDVACIREHGHEGDHTDGDRWFDNHGLQTPRDRDRSRRRATTSRSAA